MPEVVQLLYPLGFGRPLFKPPPKEQPPQLVASGARRPPLMDGAFGVPPL